MKTSYKVTKVTKASVGETSSLLEIEVEVTYKRILMKNLVYTNRYWSLIRKPAKPFDETPWTNSETGGVMRDQTLRIILWNEMVRYINKDTYSGLKKRA